MRRPGERGMALFTVIFMIIVLMPLLYLLSRRAYHHVRYNVRERQIKSARVLAGTVLSDFMRGWSEDHSADHFSPWFLERKQSYYMSAFGFSQVSFDPAPPDRTRHAIGFRAGGNYRGGMLNVRRKLFALVRFNADYLRFALVSRGNLQLDASNVSVQGGVWSGGEMRINGSGVDLGGPVAMDAGKRFIGAADTALSAFYGDAAGASILPGGAAVNAFSPRLEAPDIKPAYYRRPYSYKSAGAAETWTFTDTDGSMLVNGVPVSYSTGSAVLLAEDCDVTIAPSVVRGQITIAVINGNVTVAGDVSYSASQVSSLGVIAQRNLVFQAPGAGDMTVSGFYCVASGGGGGVSISGDPGARFTLNGTLVLPPQQNTLSSTFGRLRFICVSSRTPPSGPTSRPASPRNPSWFLGGWKGIDW
jgi:hypothetical protein